MVCAVCIFIFLLPFGICGVKCFFGCRTLTMYIQTLFNVCTPFGTGNETAW